MNVLEKENENRALRNNKRNAEAILGVKRPSVREYDDVFPRGWSTKQFRSKNEHQHNIALYHYRHLCCIEAIFTSKCRKITAYTMKLTRSSSMKLTC